MVLIFNFTQLPLQIFKIFLFVNQKFPLQEIVASFASVTSLLTQSISSLCGGALRDNPGNSEFSEFYWSLVEKKLNPPKKNTPSKQMLMIMNFNCYCKKIKKCYIDLIYIYINYT